MQFALLPLLITVPSGWFASVHLPDWHVCTWHGSAGCSPHGCPLGRIAISQTPPEHFGVEHSSTAIPQSSSMVHSGDVPVVDEPPEALDEAAVSGDVLADEAEPPCPLPAEVLAPVPPALPVLPLANSSSGMQPL